MILHLPAGQHYECTACGRCCRAAWTIAVDPSAEAKIRDSGASRKIESAGYQPLELVDGRLATSRTDQQACVFLDGENLCELHAELGGEAKPIVCQTYPFLLTQTPDGIYAALSYACPAALLGDGPPLEVSRQSLERLISQRWDEMPQGSAIKEQIPLLGSALISWEDYRLLEERLLDSFDSRRPILSLLGAAVQLVLAEPEEGRYRLPERALDEPYNFGGFDLELASMVSCNLIAICENVEAPEDRARLGSQVWNGERPWSPRFGITLPAFRLGEPPDEQARTVIERYVRNFIFGKRLLQDTLVSRLLALVCGLSILLYYVEALTPIEGPEPALDRAFTLVESELLSHTKSFDGFFVEFEQALRNVRDSLRGE